MFFIRQGKSLGSRIRGPDSMNYSSNYRRVDSEVDRDEDLEGEVDPRRPLPDGKSRDAWRYALASAVFASLNTILLGYDGGVMSGAILFIQEDLKITEVQVEVFVGFASFVSLVGSLGGGKMADLIGRKWTMGLASVIFQTGNLMMTLAQSFEVLMAGRLLAGIGAGFGFVAAIVYIAEISPSVTRGAMTSFPEIFVNFGILLGYVSNYAFAGLPITLSWRVMLGVGILPSVFLGVALFIIPESPRWLVMQNRLEDARSVLLKTLESEKEVEERLAEIKLAANLGSSQNHEEKAAWRDLLKPSVPLWKMLITGIGIQCFQQITGIDAIVYYGPRIFKDAGITGTSNLLAVTIVIGVTKTAFILIAILLIDKLGRKPLLYVSTIGMTVCLLVTGASLSLHIRGRIGAAIAILSICGNVAFFSMGIGPICWVVTSEIFPLRQRALAAALGSIGNRVCNGLITMSFLSLARSITVGGTFLLYFSLSALSVAFVYVLVPETKGKSLEEIQSLFQEPSESKQLELELEEVDPHMLPGKLHSYDSGNRPI